MNSRLYGRAWATAAFLFLGATVAANVIVDPYGVFGSRVLPLVSTPNTRFLTYDRYLAGREAVTVAVVGSSRVGFGIRAEGLDARFAPARFAAIWGQAATAPDHAAIARALLRDRAAGRNQLSTLIVFVDVHTLGTRTTDQSFYVRHHPQVAGDSLGRFYFDHLFNLPWRELRAKIARNFGAGAADPRPWWDRAGPIAPPPPAPTERVAERMHFADDVRILDALARSAAATGVRLVYAVGPMHPHWRERAERDRYDDAVAMLARRVAIIHFPMDPWLDRREWWFDSAHFSPVLGEMIVARALGLPVAAPESFGQTLPSRGTAVPGG